LLTGNRLNCRPNFLKLDFDEFLKRNIFLILPYMSVRQFWTEFYSKVDLLRDKIGFHFIMILQFLFLSKFTKKLIIIYMCNDKLVLLIFSKVNKSNTFWHVCFLKNKIICSDNISQLEPTMLCSVCMTEQRNGYSFLWEVCSPQVQNILNLLIFVFCM